ncbi:MAG: DUF5057 domain-containing protein, partial [Oscillospiraceae bacterium]
INAEVSDGTGIAVDTRRVDYASRLYSALSGSIGYDNVMSTKSIDSPLLRKYLNLSKPAIEWLPNGYPTEYALNGTNISGLTADAKGKFVVTYKFKITNKTDATPNTTTYDARLFIDQNSNGLYEDREQISDIVVRGLNADGSLGALVSPARPTSGSGLIYSLKADTDYCITREMPEDYAGILPWKLEIVKNNAENIHTSVHKYSHITREKSDINILQILHKDGGGLNLTTNETYKRLLPTVPDFNVNISTINANSLSDGKLTVKNKGKDVTYNNLKDCFAAYDMLVLGFADMYGEISDDAANAILEFSKNHAVLFTHDTTSIVNLPVNNYQTTSRGDSVDRYRQWGYSFNTILRSAVGLDRYGVTDPTYGRTTKYLANSDKQSGVVAQGVLSSEDAKKVSDAGYTIAYAPVSRALKDCKLETIAETQGFAKFTPVRYTGIKNQKFPTNDEKYTTGGENNTTGQISQVNEGQITTYPFNLNTKDFGGSLDTLDIAQTHDQYYQLNLNASNIVVWYCLSGGNFASLPNDVTNSYYIYSVGNVTYSGAGHSDNSVTDNEAKLFINTMIAAFRTAEEQPTVSFKSDSAGSADVSYYFLTSDYSNEKGDTLSGDFLIEDGTKLYFMISDPTLQKNRPMNLYLYYECFDQAGKSSKSGDPVKLDKVYLADSGAKAESVSGGLVYSFKLSDIPSLIDSLKNASSAKLYLAVTTGSSAPDTKPSAKNYVT